MNRASPYIFILCIEILLIKIKCKANIGIDNCNFISEWVNQNGMEKEGTAEGFADDLTLLFKFTGPAMEMILGIMAEFMLCSGLELNKNKTQLMIVGTDRVGTGTMVNGIVVVDKVKILGLTIDRKLTELGKNWEVAIRKMEKLANFWKLQKLSIVGRILVAKTYQMSQATFFLGALPLDKNTGDKINLTLANYVKGTDRVISKEHWCISRELGEYGLVVVHIVNTCIKGAWINRWILKCGIN